MFVRVYRPGRRLAGNTHPLSGPLDLLAVGVKVGENLLAHLFCGTTKQLKQNENVVQ